MDDLKPRRLRPLDPPLGHYLRPGFNDHTVLTQFMSENRPVATCLVLGARFRSRHKDLIGEARRLGIESVVDPMTFELTTPTEALLSGLPEVPWSKDSQVYETTDGRAGSGNVARHLAGYVVEGGASAVLAPSRHVV